MIRVIHIVSNISRNDGIMSIMMNLNRNIDKNELLFDFITFNVPEINYLDEIESLGGKVYDLSKVKKMSLYYEISRIFSMEIKYNTIHIHSLNYGILPILISKKYNILNRIVHSHSTKSSSQLLKRIRNAVINRIVLLYANKYIACSDTAAEYLFNRKIIENKKVFILNNAIDCNEFSFCTEKRKNTRNKFGIKNEFVVGHVGRFSKEKNHEFIVKVFFEILKINECSRLLLIGDGPTKSKIMKLTEMLNIQDKVTFAGTLNDTSSIYSAIDLLIFPSFFEGVPLVLVEAQACDTPCIVSEKITADIQINSNYEIMKLIDAPQNWAQKIIRMNVRNKRNSKKDSIARAGYCIKDSSKKIQDYYNNLKMDSENIWE
ncbi:MAG: glycosyltransferase [Clostridiales bacterium]|nr:glycosyltransferase [Clostridiales bacterium]